jgi:opacity protein-like surface antigen
MSRINLPLLGILLTFAAVPCVAQSVGTPQVYVGVHGGKVFGDSDLSDGPSSINGLGSQGWAAGVHGGLDLPLGKSSGLVPFAGVYGGYDWTNVEFSVTNGAVTMHAPFGDSWYAGGRLGVMTTTGSKYYVLGAYRDGSLDVKDFGLPKTIALHGWDAGVGAEFTVTHFVTLGVEGIYTKFGDETLVGPLKVTPRELGVMARLNFALGEPTPASLFTDTSTAEPQGCDPKMANCKRVK